MFCLADAQRHPLLVACPARARDRPGSLDPAAYAPTGLPSMRRTTIVADRGGMVLPCTFEGQDPVGCWMLMKKVRRSGV